MADDPPDHPPERAPTPKGVFVAGLAIMVRSIRRHPGTFAIAVTGAAVFAATTVASTIVLGRVTDRVILPAFDEGVSAMTAVGGAAAILAVGLIKAAGAVTRRYFAGITEARTEADLRRQLAHRYQALPLSFHRARPTGELLAHADADVLAAAQVLHPLPLSLAVLFIVVIAAVAMLLTDPILAVVGIALMPALALLNKVYTAKVEEPATRAQELVGEVSAIAHESFDGALVVKTLGREEAETARFSVAAERLRAERMQMGRVRSSFEPALAALPGVGILMLLAVGTWRISTGASSAGDLVQFASLFTLLSFPMTVLGFLLAEIPRAVVGGRRIDGVLAEPVPEERRRASPLPPGPLGIEVAGVSLRYDGHRALEEVTFAVPPSTSVAIVGATGSGKSTLVALLLCLLEPDRGRVRIGGASVGGVDRGELRSSIAVAFQEAFLFATTIRDNIAVDRPLDDGEIAKAAKIAQIHDFITGLGDGYATVVGERGLSLSGGQRQRVALARALAGRPRVLLLDDATSAVDPVVETAILDGLKRELDTTLLVVAHRVSTIRLAEQVVYVDDGRVVAVGTHDELLRAQPGYGALVRAYEAEETAPGEVVA